MLVSAGAHGYGTYFIFGSFSFAMFFFVWFLIPETKGISLEKMDGLFGGIQGGKGEGEEAQIEHASTKPASSEIIIDGVRSEKAVDLTHAESK